MTIKKFIIFTILQWLLLAFLKVEFLENQLLANKGLQDVVYWLLTAVVVSALVRRLGVLNFLEAFFVAVVWSVLDLLSDLVVTSGFTGLEIFRQWQYWVGCGILALSVIFFHKKRHIKIREQMTTTHQGGPH